METGAGLGLARRPVPGAVLALGGVLGDGGVAPCLEIRLHYEGPVAMQGGERVHQWGIEVGGGLRFWPARTVDTQLTLGAGPALARGAGFVENRSAWLPRASARLVSAWWFLRTVALAAGVQAHPVRAAYQAGDGVPGGTTPAPLAGAWLGIRAGWSGRADTGPT